MCVCVCVCVRAHACGCAREREREKKNLPCGTRTWCLFNISSHCIYLDSRVMGFFSFQKTAPALCFEIKHFIFCIFHCKCLMDEFFCEKFITPIRSSVCAIFSYIIYNIYNWKSKEICQILGPNIAMFSQCTIHVSVFFFRTTELN